MQKRHEEILLYLDKHEQASIEDLLLIIKDRSPETIRRDLSLLANKGLLRRIHGGAIRINKSVLNEDKFSTRMNIQQQEKESIAKYAASLLKSGDTLFIDTGSTTIYFAKEIAKIPKLTVITNSMLIASHLAANAIEPKIFLLGGHYDTATSFTYGYETISQIKKFHTDYAFLTVGSIHNTAGCMDFNIDSANVAHTMLKQAKIGVIMCDSSKFEQVSMAKMADFDDFDILVTNHMPKDALLTSLHQAKIQILASEAAKDDL